MTTEQKEISIALGMVRYLPATFDKRLGNNLQNYDANFITHTRCYKLCLAVRLAQRDVFGLRASLCVRGARHCL